MIKLNKDIEYEKIDDEMLILVLETKSFYKLNKTGSQIFELISNEKVYDTVIDKFSKLNNIIKEEAKEDIDYFIKDCKIKKIIY